MKQPFLTAIALLALVSTIIAAPEIGQPAPDFKLTDTNGVQHSLSDFKGKPVVLEWFNHNCPFVVKHYSSGNMQGLQERYTSQGVIWLSINSTNPSHRDYRNEDESNAATAKRNAKTTAVLLDKDGSVGKLYDAKTTPHMFVIDADGKLVYMGAIDSIKSTDVADIPKATNFVAEALDALLAEKPIETSNTQPYGCSVKY